MKTSIHFGMRIVRGLSYFNIAPQWCFLRPDGALFA